MKNTQNGRHWLSISDAFIILFSGDSGISMRKEVDGRPTGSCGPDSTAFFLILFIFSFTALVRLSLALSLSLSSFRSVSPRSVSSVIFI